MVKLSLSMKLPLSGVGALMLPFAAPTGYGLGKSGWITARFSRGEEIPIGMLGSWLDESYRAIAPKKLVARLPKSTGQPEKGDSGGESRRKTTPRRKAVAKRRVVPKRKVPAKRMASPRRIGIGK